MGLTQKTAEDSTGTNAGLDAFNTMPELFES